jgi:hypothetical protein
MLAIIQSKIFRLPISYKKQKIKIHKTVILPLVLYGYETRSLTFREKHRQGFLEQSVVEDIQT